MPLLPKGASGLEKNNAEKSDKQQTEPTGNKL
jgi:hypothetical protein